MPDGGSLWARVRLQGRKAARWRFQIVLNSGTFKLKGRSNKRPPHRLSLLVTRKKRNCRSQPASWHVTDPTKPNNAALIIPNNLEPIEFETTFNSRTALNNETYEVKQWSFLLEEVTKTGQRKALAQTKIDLSKLVAEELDDKIFHEFTDIEFKPFKGRVEAVKLSFQMAGVLLRSGHATDDDMQSLASLLTTNTLDIGNLDDFSDSISDVSSGFNASHLSELKNLTAGMNALLQDDYDELSIKSSSSHASRNGTLNRSGTLEKSTRIVPSSTPEPRPAAKTPPTSRKLRPSRLEVVNTIDRLHGDEEEEETVGGNAQELLSWAREATKYSVMVNVTNLTSSFRSGIALGVILKKYSPENIELHQLDPRLAKGNLKTVLAAYKKAGLDLYGVININEMATKPDKLAVITALHMIKTKFDSPKSAKLREKPTRRDVDTETVRSLMFDSNTVWSSLSVFRIETLMEEMRRLEEVPDMYSEAVDNILDDLGEFSSSEDEGEEDEEEAFETEIQKVEQKAEISKEIEYEKERMLKSEELIEEILHPSAPEESKSCGHNESDSEANTCETETLPGPPVPPEEQLEVETHKVALSGISSPNRKSSSSSLDDEKDPWADENVTRRSKDDLVGNSGNRNSLDEFLSLEQELQEEEFDEVKKEETLPLTMIELMHRERMSTLIEESDDEIDDNMPNLSIIDEETLDNEVLTPEFDLSEFTKALDFSKDLLNSEESKPDDHVSLSGSDKEFEEMERLASLESEEAFNGLNDTEATIHEDSSQSKIEKVSISETSQTLIDEVTPVFDNNKNLKSEENSTDTISDQRLSASVLPIPDEIVEESMANSANPSPIEKIAPDVPPFIPELKEDETIEDSIEAAIDNVSPPFVPEPVVEPSIEDSIDTYFDEKTVPVITPAKLTLEPTQEESIEDSIEAFISSSERRGSIHDAPEVNKFIDQEKTEDTSSKIHSSKSENVTESTNPFEKEEDEPSNPFEVEEKVLSSNPFDEDQRDEESGKNPFDDEPVHDEIKEENSSPPRPIRALAPASQAEDLLSRLKDATEVDVSSIKSENFSNTSSDQAIDVRPSSSANDADSSDGDLERIAVKIDESGNVMDESDGESSIEMVDENEKQKRAEMMKQEDLIHKQNEEKFMMILQQLTEREAQILDEQDEVDDRAKVVETDLRLAMKQDQRKEAELTGEWLALVQKRDDLLKSGSLIGLQRKRAKLELEYLDVQRQCRVLSLKHEYEKTEEDRNSEETLIQKCVQLVQDKAIIEEEMGELEQEIDDQRERHAVQMQKNLMEQEKLKQAENSTSIFGIKRSWFS